MRKDPASVKPTRVRKTASTRKSTHRNIDDTDTEDDDDNFEATTNPTNAWMDEWKSYLNTDRKSVV